MKRITATLAGVALVIPALVAVAPAASAATSRDYFVAKSGGRTHCLYLEATGAKREVVYSVQAGTSGKTLRWEGPKGSGWRAGHELRQVWVGDEDDGYPDLTRGAKTRLKVTGSGNVRAVGYRKAGKATVTSPTMRAVGWSRYAASGCPQD